MSSKHGLTAISESNTGAIHCSQEAPNLEDSCGCRGAHSQEDWYVCIPSTESNKYYSSKSYCKHNLLQRIFILQEKEKETVCHQESTTAKEKLKLALQSHGAPNHDLPDIVVFHLHTLLCGVALAATLPP